MEIAAARQYYEAREKQHHAEREAERQQWLRQVRGVVAACAAERPGVRRVYLFGSLAQPGRFRPDSDIDLAVECDTLEAESSFWQALERQLRRDVDLRPLAGAVAEAVVYQGELLYERQDSGLVQPYPG